MWSKIWISLPVAGESDLAALTDGWLLMVKKPLELIFPSCSFIIFVSGWSPFNSVHGLLFKLPRQSSLNFWFVTVCNKKIFKCLCIDKVKDERKHFLCYLLNILNAFQWDNPFLLKLLVTWSFAHELSKNAFRSGAFIGNERDRRRWKSNQASPRVDFRKN